MSTETVWSETVKKCCGCCNGYNGCHCCRGCDGEAKSDGDGPYWGLRDGIS